MFKFKEISPVQPTGRFIPSMGRLKGRGSGVFVSAGLAAAVVGLLLASHAHASGGPYVVDDADMIDPGTCQLESFYSRLGSGTDLAFGAPGCNLANVEWTLGLTRARLDGETSSGVEMQGKYLLRPTSTGGVGVAIAAGIGRGLSSGGRLSDGFVNLPMTWELPTLARTPKCLPSSRVPGPGHDS